MQANAPYNSGPSNSEAMPIRAAETAAGALPLGEGSPGRSSQDPKVRQTILLDICHMFNTQSLSWASAASLSCEGRDANSSWVLDLGDF